MNLTEQDYELLSRYLDQELPASIAKQLEQRLAVESPLAEALADLRSLQVRMQNAYKDIGDQAIPARISALLRPQAETARILPFPRRRAKAWSFALAASLVVAASATLVTQWRLDSALPGAVPGADTQLATVLESSPSSATDWLALDDGRNVRPLLSFRGVDGNWCREYLIADTDGNWHGVACRGNQGWANRALTATQPAGSSDESRPAGAMAADEVADFIDRNAADIPLDASQEASVIAGKWQ